MCASEKPPSWLGAPACSKAPILPGARRPLKDAGRSAFRRLGPAIGSLATKAVPCSTDDVTVSEPPWARPISEQMCRPRPRPSRWRPEACLQKGSKIRSSEAAGIGSPWFHVDSSKVSPSQLARTSISPSAKPCTMALPTRFDAICWMRGRSQRMGRSITTLLPMRRPGWATRAASTTSSIAAAARSVHCRFSCMPEPRRPLAKSRVSSISCAIRLTFLISCSSMPIAAGSTARSLRTCAHAETAASGLRRSWPRMAMNCSRSSLWARSPISADCVSSRSRSSSSWVAISAAKLCSMASVLGSSIGAGRGSMQHRLPK